MDLIAPSTSSAISGTVAIMHLPSLPMESGSMPSSSQALATPSRTGILPSSTLICTLDFSAHSLSVLAMPPLVGSFIATTPPTRRALSIILFSGCTSLLISLSKPYPSRKERRATPWSPMYPEAMMTSPLAMFESVHHRLSTSR